MSRLAIYSIVKDGAATAEKFMGACRDADTVIVGDTGSTDNTTEILQDLGATVLHLRILPWRFDMARNAVLAYVPTHFDLCFALDVDEYPQAGWRDHIEPLWNGEEHSRLWFKYIHSFTEAGAPANVGTKGFAHNREGYMWKHRVHEDIYWQKNPADEKHLRIPELVVEHRQTPHPHRMFYTELLKEECASESVTSRHIFWLCRELHSQQEWNSLLACCHAFMAQKDVWNVEKAHCLSMQASAYAHTGNQTDALRAHMRACDAAPSEREPWLELTRMYFKNKQWAQAYGTCMQCLGITHRADHYLTTDSAWDYAPHYMAAICMKRMGVMTMAAIHAKDAAAYNTSSTAMQSLLRELEGHM